MSDEIAARLDRLEDYAALEKLINTYHWLADGFEWKAWSETMTEDAEFDFPAFGMMHGRQEIHDTCKGNMDEVYGAMQHVIVNLSFELTGTDAATGHGNLVFTGIPDADKPEQTFMAGGRYRWEFRRGPQGWLISKTRLDFIWNSGQDSDEVFEASAAG